MCHTIGIYYGEMRTISRTKMIEFLELVGMLIFAASILYVSHGLYFACKDYYNEE